MARPQSDCQAMPRPLCVKIIMLCKLATKSFCIKGCLLVYVCGHRVFCKLVVTKIWPKMEWGGGGGGGGGVQFYPAKFGMGKKIMAA